MPVSDSNIFSIQGDGNRHKFGIRLYQPGPACALGPRLTRGDRRDWGCLRLCTSQTQPGLASRRVITNRQNLRKVTSRHTTAAQITCLNRFPELLLQTNTNNFNMTLWPINKLFHGGFASERFDERDSINLLSPKNTKESLWNSFYWQTQTNIRLNT